MKKEIKRDENSIELYDPFEALNSIGNLFESVARIPQRIIGNYIASPYKMPDADIIDNGDSYTVKIDMPGVDKKDIKLRIVDNTITVHAEKSEEKENKGKNYYSKERMAMGYYRSIELPEPVKPNTAKAKMNNGTLSIDIEKAEEAKGTEIKID